MTINILDLVTYFIIYSFLGWILESIYCSILEKKLVNRGFLHGPVCPIYGAGALIMYIFLHDYKENPILIFCLGFVVLSIWEYIVGVLLEKTLNTKYWDYSDSKYNLQGRVCLLNSIFWGVLSVVFISFVHPVISNLISNIDRTTLLRVDVIASTILVVDGIVSLMQVIKIDEKMKKLDEINKTIKQKIAEIKKYNNEKNTTQSETNQPINEEFKTVANQSIIEELKAKQEKIKASMYKNISRLKKAFPSINSEKVSKILNYKRDIKQKEKNKKKN